MTRLPRWLRPKPGPPPPDAVDPDLWAIFGGRAGRTGLQLLEAAEELRRRIQAHPPEAADPEFQARLRTNLLREARAGHQPVRRRRRLLIPATVGIGLAAVAAAVAVSLLALPAPPGGVQVKAPVDGHHRVPVTQAIQISFNRPMNEAAVVAGLTVKPAVAYQTRWLNSKTLVLSPEHALAPNVGYVVSIPPKSALAQDGTRAPAAIVIPFGTGSSPSTPQGQIPTLVSVTRLAVAQGVTSLSYLPDGSLLVLSSGPPLVLPSSPPTASAAPSPSSPAIQGTSFGTLYLLSPSPTVIATDATGAVASPDSQEIAYWTPASRGGLDLEVVSAAAGGTPETLATSAESDPGLAWLDSGDLLYAAAGQLREVSLAGQVTAVYPSVQVDPSGYFSLSPSAQLLFARPGGVPTLFSLPSGTSTALSGMVGTPAWSGSGPVMAYVASAGGVESVESTSSPGAATAVLTTAASGVVLSDLSFDASGTYLAYTAAAIGGPAQLMALDVTSRVSGTLGGLTPVSDPVWAPAGNQLSALTSLPNSGSQSVVSLLLSGTPNPASNSNPAAREALAAAAALAQLQVTGSAAALASIDALLAPGNTIPAPLLLPGKFDRFYAVSVTPTAAGAASYTVDLRLVRDATSALGPAYLAETVSVQTGAAAPLITAITSGELTPVPTGPLVLSVATTSSGVGSATFSIQFDSDLNPLTVGAQSIRVSAGSQPLPGAQFGYQSLTRTVTVTVSLPSTGPVTLTVGPPLADVDNTQMQSPYQVILQPSGS